MTWNQVSRFLVGSVPRPTLREEVGTDMVTESLVLSESLKVFNAHFANKRELEALQRVIAFVMDAAVMTNSG